MTGALRIISSICALTWMKSLRRPVVLRGVAVEQHERPAGWPGSRSQRWKNREAP